MHETKAARLGEEKGWRKRRTIGEKKIGTGKKQKQKQGRKTRKKPRKRRNEKRVGENANRQGS